LAGKYAEEVVDAAKALTAREPGLLVDEALRRAEAELRRRQELEQAAADARARQNVRTRVGYQAQAVDPFGDVFRVFGQERPDNDLDGQFGRSDPSDRQLEILAKMKIPLGAGVSRREASALIGAAFKRRELGLCTFGQARALQRRGYDTREITFAQAGALMTALNANNWRALTREQNAAILSRPPRERVPGEDDGEDRIR
jgi:hypothetical protein